MGTAYRGVPWSNSGFGETAAFQVTSYRQFSSSSFSFWENSVVELYFADHCFVILYNLKRSVAFEEFGSRQFVQIIQCLATLHTQLPRGTGPFLLPWRLHLKAVKVKEHSTRTPGKGGSRRCAPVRGEY